MKYQKRYQNLHLLSVQLLIRVDNQFKAGVYMLINKKNNKKYIGSAATNRINTKFRNHFFNGTGSIVTYAAVKKYGIENFEFYILEYFPGFVKKENLSSAHIALLELETKYIQELKPEYNILQFGEHNLDYKHIESSKIKLSEEYSQERKQLLSKITSLRSSILSLRTQLKNPSKAVTLYNKDGSVHSKYSGIRVMAKSFNCCNKTINKAIKNKTIFRDIGIITLDQILDKNP